MMGTWAKAIIAVEVWRSIRFWKYFYVELTGLLIGRVHVMRGREEPRTSV